MNRRTVVVVHREPLIAESIASALERYPWLAPIAIGSRAEDALRARADAAVIDAGLEGAGEAAETLAARGRRAILLGHAANVSIAAIGTDRPVEELAHALAPGVDPNSVITARLTAREREVLMLVAKGLAGKQVATLLGISPKTIEQHKTRIYEKLGVANQAAAVAIAGRGCEGVAWISTGT
ncbi:MAG TPA: LuxR C-terminal-related transcriptional regulator [Actinomycetota bacterium]|nr:LuxR C-terminal-related transcriptional regulator [Actinomycetota bacterium]